MAELPQLAAVVRCQVCGTVPADSAEEADKRAEKHRELTGHPVAVIVDVVTPEAENALIARALATCRADALVHAADPEIEPGPVGELTCSMAVHDGHVHYDPVDGLFWIPAQKGMTRDQAETVAARIREAMAA